LHHPRTKSLSFCDDKHFPTSWKREGHGFLSMESKSFYSEIQDTQVEVLHQDASVHQPSDLSDLLGVLECRIHGLDIPEYIFVFLNLVFVFILSFFPK